MARDIAKEMDSARKLANGTMFMWIIFDTREEVDAAREWMKGKQKVKTLTPMTAEDAENARAKLRKKAAKKVTSK